MACYKLGYQCLFCDAVFVVYTENLGNYEINGTYCPQCSHTGTCLRHDTIQEGDISDVVPGDSALAQIGQHIEEHHEAGELNAYALKEDVRRRIDNRALCDSLKSLLSPDLRVLLDTLELKYGHAPYEDGTAK